MRTPTPMSAALALAAALGLGAAACSDGSSSGDEAAATTTTATGATTGMGHGAHEGVYHALPPAEFEAQMADSPGHVINVHVPYEGEIEGTTAFIDYQVIKGDSRLPADKSTPLLLYCRSGRMSKLAAETLEAEGYTHIYDLEGGMVAWEAAGKQLLHNPR